MSEISQQQLTQALMRTLYKTYYKWIVEATPKKTSVVADGWDVVPTSEGVSIVNEEYGLIVNTLEFGSKPYIIKPKNKQALKFNIGGKDIFTKEIHHPGIKARKFITKILDNQNYKKQFQEMLEEEFMKLIV